MVGGCVEIDNRAPNTIVTCESNNNSRIVRVPFEDDDRTLVTSSNYCSESFYIPAPDTNSHDICQLCTPVDNHDTSINILETDVSISCSNENDSRIGACISGFYKDSSGVSDVCISCTRENIADDADVTCDK